MSENTKICRNCGNLCSVNFNYCPKCGTSLEELKCRNCGEPVLDGASFCYNCGAPVIVGEKATGEDAFPAELCTDSDIPNGEVYCDKNDTLRMRKPKRNATKLTSEKKKSVLNLIKDVTVVTLCLMFFILSFCGVYSIDYKDIFDSHSYSLKTDITAVDFIEIMGASARQEDADLFAEQAEEAYDEFFESFQADIEDSDSKSVTMSLKTQRLYRRSFVLSWKHQMASEDIKGTSAYVNMILCGVFCLLNIFFCATMLALSLAALILNILKKSNRLGKLYLVMPVYLFVDLFVLFMATVGVAASAAPVAGAMIASLLFAAIAIVATVVWIFVTSKNRSVMAALPKLISVAVCVIVCACMFAPFFTSKYDIKLQNRSQSKVYPTPLDASLMLTYLSPDEIEELNARLEEDEYAVYEEYMDYLEEMFSDESITYTYKEFKQYVGKRISKDIVPYYLLRAIGDYSLTGALSLGFYIILLVFILLGTYSTVAIGNLFSKKKVGFKLLIIALVVVLISFALSVGLVCMYNYFLEEIETFSYTIGGGALSAVLLLIVDLVLLAVLGHVAKKEYEKYDDKVLEPAANSVDSDNLD